MKLFDIYEAIPRTARGHALAHRPDPLRGSEDTSCTKDTPCAAVTHSSHVIVLIFSPRILNAALSVPPSSPHPNPFPDSQTQVDFDPLCSTASGYPDASITYLAAVVVPSVSVACLACIDQVIFEDKGLASPVTEQKFQSVCTEVSLCGNE